MIANYETDPPTLFFYLFFFFIRPNKMTEGKQEYSILLKLLKLVLLQPKYEN